MMKFKGNVKEMKTFLKDGLITGSNGGTKFKFVEGEGIVEEHEADYEQVLVEFDWDNNNVIFKDAGNEMQVPMETIREANKIIEIK